MLVNEKTKKLSKKKFIVLIGVGVVVAIIGVCASLMGVVLAISGTVCLTAADPQMRVIG